MKNCLRLFLILSSLNCPHTQSQDFPQKISQQDGDITESIKREGNIYRCVDGFVLAIHQNKISFAVDWPLRVEKSGIVPEKHDQLNPTSSVIIESCYKEEKPHYWWHTEYKREGKLYTSTTSCDVKIAFIESDPNNKNRATFFSKGSDKDATVARTTCFPVKQCGPLPPERVFVAYNKGTTLCHKR